MSFCWLDFDAADIRRIRFASELCRRRRQYLSRFDSVYIQRDLKPSQSAGLLHARRIVDRYAALLLDVAYMSRPLGDLRRLVQSDFIELREHLGADKSNQEWAWDFGLEPFDPVAIPEEIQDILTIMEGNARRARAASQLFRLTECVREHPDWYIIFDTLTLGGRARHEPEEWLCGDGWATYKRRWQGEVRKAVFGGNTREAQQAPTDSYCFYFAVLENFGQRHPHAHCIWICKDIPETWKRDPNAGRPIANRREINPAKLVWEGGWSTPIAVRLMHGDIWTRNGWKWPLDKQGRPVRQGGPESVAGYVGKYMTKDRRHGKWRTRMTRGMGKARLKDWVRRIPTRLLRPMSSGLHLADRIDPLMRPSLPPLSLLAQMSRAERLSRLWASQAWTMIAYEDRRPRRSGLLQDIQALASTEREDDLQACELLSGLGDPPASDRRLDDAVQLLYTLAIRPVRPRSGTRDYATAELPLPSASVGIGPRAPP